MRSVCVCGVKEKIKRKNKWDVCVYKQILKYQIRRSIERKALISVPLKTLLSLTLTLKSMGEVYFFKLFQIYIAKHFS